MGLVVHIDGGSRGNPGPAGAGVVIHTSEGVLLHEGAFFLGTQTNNAAEYHGLIRALQRVATLPIQTVTFRSDSELLVRQVTGQYQIKSPSLARLYTQVQLLLLKVGAWQFRHIPRAENQRADELANLAMDKKQDIVVFDAAALPPGLPPVPCDPPPAREAKETARAAPPAPAPVGGQRVRVSVAKPPAEAGCPARGIGGPSLVLGGELPAGICLHAAQAIVPTVLAVQNTAASEFAAVPTLTVRCGRNECGAAFHIGPELASNGVRA